MKLAGASTRVVITGATGFIGGRLADVLASARHVDVTALVRDFSRVARISRHNIRLHRADLLSSESFRPVLSGVDTVFHCAYEWGRGDRREREFSLRGTLNLAAEAKAASVRRFVYTSSMAVYGYQLPATVTEQTPYRPATAYGRIKAETERALLSFGRKNALEVVVVQPTKVFGPYDFNFTVPFIRRIAARQLWLIENGTGLVSPAYIDNVIQGMLLAAETDQAAHGKFILADGVTLQWREFVDRFAALCDGASFGSVTRADCEAAWRAQARRPSFRQLVHALFLNSEVRELYPRYPLYRTLRGPLKAPFVRRVKELLGEPLNNAPPDNSSKAAEPSLPSLTEYRDFTRRGAFSIAHAQSELGYIPHMSLADALQRTKEWLQYARLIEAL